MKPLRILIMVLCCSPAAICGEVRVQSRARDDGITEIIISSNEGKVLKTYEVNLSKHHSPATERTKALRWWESYKFGAFVCYNTNQFSGKELCKAGDPKIYNPTKLNVDTWVEAIKAAGMIGEGRWPVVREAAL